MVYFKSINNLEDWHHVNEHASNHDVIYRYKLILSWGDHGITLHPDGATLLIPMYCIPLASKRRFYFGSNLYRRTFRTKMETNHNSVPQPVIHRIAQRTGTNVMELDFEVIDTDDDNVTVGILAYCGSDKLVPQAWLNGTGSKIGTPIATNTVHPWSGM